MKNFLTSFFDDLSLINYLAFCVKNGKLTEPADAFDHPCWDYVRSNVSRKTEEIGRQGFMGAAMLLMSELEYTGVTETLNDLEKRFKLRKK